MSQVYENYTADDHEVWSLLYQCQLAAVEKVASADFMNGLQQLNIDKGMIPAFPELNRRLMRATGWQIYAVPGLVANAHFFEQMARRRFAVTAWIRKKEELDYLEEPDMFHDLFGHLPLLADGIVSNYLFRLAAIALKYLDSEEVIEAIARLYWYTIEFGLVKENRQVKIYGAGILSSIGETRYCLSKAAKRVPFDLEKILDTPYIKDNYQQQYFVLESMDQLTAAVKILELHLDIIYRKN